MGDRILCVDDDINVLEAFKRQLRKEFNLETAVGPEEGLRIVMEHGPFAVVVSDLKMPGMNGIEFLSKVRDHEPDTVRVLLTGNAELKVAIDAINEGQIFRFLTKPCAPELIAKTLRAALIQNRLIRAERELLEQTLSGSIRVLCDILGLVNPEAFGRSSRIAQYVESLAKHLHVSETWSIKTAAILSQIGCVVLPESILKKVYRGETLNRDESELFDQHPFVASDLIAKIPRMKHVAEIIRYQNKCYDGSGTPRDDREGQKIPMEARILKVALDFDALESAGNTKMQAFEEIKKRKGWYDEDVVTALKTAFAEEIQYEARTAVIADLQPGMVLDEDLKSSENVLLCARGQEVRTSTIMRLVNCSKTIGVREPFRVLVPILPEVDSVAAVVNRKQ